VQNYFGARVKRYILGQVLTSEPANSGMGNALAEIQLGTFMMIIRYDAVNLGESITRGPLKFLQQVNHPKYANVPLYFKIKTDTPDLEKKMDAMYKAWQMGMAIPTSEVADTISCRQPKPDEDALRNPAVQQAVPLAANAPPDGTHPSMIGDPTQRLKAELVNALRGVAA
jgi:phage gp29-like protein